MVLEYPVRKNYANMYLRNRFLLGFGGCSGQMSSAKSPNSSVIYILLGNWGYYNPSFIKLRYNRGIKFDNNTVISKVVLLLHRNFDSKKVI